MAVGFAKDGAEQLEIQAVVDAAITHARSQISTGESLKHCLECDGVIPPARRLAVKGCKYCITCQTNHDSVFRREPRNCWHRSMK